MAGEACNHVKVLFRVVEDEGSANVETLWATALGGDLYRIDNLPFFAYGVSWNDIVIAPFDAAEGFPCFDRVVEKSGHRTVRLICSPPLAAGNESERLLQDIVAHGCSYEGANPTYVVIDIPPNVDFETVCNHLVDAEAEWEHADPRHSDLYPDAV
jgi:hypothetical protein